MNTNTTEKPRKKMGRPTKEKKGTMMWIPADFIDSVQVYIEVLKQQQQKQVKQ
jgi:hypothetical protein